MKRARMAPCFQERRFSPRAWPWAVPSTWKGLAVGSTFDLDLVKAIYATAAVEARAVGIHMLSTLVMETLRDPRMGRNEEAYTEDPYLYMRMGEAIVRGTQGYDISAPDKVIAVLTDFPTQSEPVS